MRYTIFFVLFFLIGHSSASYKFEKILDGQGVIWGMTFMEDNILFTEREGKVKLFNLKNKTLSELKGAPKVLSEGQGGLLDVKKDPDFNENKFIYFTYSKKMGDQGTTALARGVFSDKKIADLKDLFVAKGEADSGIHFGSRIAFDDKQKVYISIGERGERDNAQNLLNHFGSIVRLNKDGSVPKDNPFIGNKKALPEIYSYGHRNPQGLVFDEKSKQIYAMEHGPRGGDEINLIEAGKNYGWPVISYGKEYWGPVDVGESTHKKGMEQPLKQFTPSIAPCGLVFYRGERYPKLKNSLISGALKLTHLNVYFPKSKKEMRLFDDKGKRIRSVAVSANDFIYFSTDAGEIFKILPEK